MREKWAELKLQTKMATLCGVRRLFSSSSRTVRLAAAPVGPRGTWRRSCRELSTSSAWRAGVDPAEESVFGQDHVEMREVSSVATPSLPSFYWFKVSVHSHLTLSLSLSLSRSPGTKQVHRERDKPVCGRMGECQRFSFTRGRHTIIIATHPRQHFLIYVS